MDFSRRCTLCGYRIAVETGCSVSSSFIVQQYTPRHFYFRSSVTLTEGTLKSMFQFVQISSAGHTCKASDEDGLSVNLLQDYGLLGAQGG